jgi:hypothetical protein
MGEAQITSYFWLVNDPNNSDDSDNEYFAWDLHACCDNNTPPYVADEDVDLDDPDDNDLEQEDIRINRELRSLSAAIDADEWLPKGEKQKLESQGGALLQTLFFFLSPFLYQDFNLFWVRTSKDIYQRPRCCKQVRADTAQVQKANHYSRNAEFSCHPSSPSHPTTYLCPFMVPLS